MSPLSVAQTLPLKEIYDVVVIDEASQMRPEYSIGCIARAKQAVIVGDPNQLPPTRFFQTQIDLYDLDEDYSDESILDMALTVFQPTRTLIWHYRSRHEDLIRFSNAEFYSNLMIPITADKNEPNKGIEHHYLKDARYRVGSELQVGGVNPIEGKELVKEVIKTMETRPNESIGVATMNIKQRDYIQREFDVSASRNHQVRQYLSDWIKKDHGLEEFFVKNLENVQGDQRDIIFISTGFGPHDDTGTVYQRFNPINQQGGWRRLNVLFTRAKNQIHFFTSLKPSDVKVGDTSKRGVKVLQKYIGFAETKELLEGEPTGGPVESPFQQWAIDQIKSFPGYSADHEIGVGGYRIDIAVKHEDYPNGYILGVETDGATYHSLISARDRDLLRQTILEGYGWVFHRIWSTDWIRDPVGVKRKLKSVLDLRLSDVQQALERRKKREEQESITPDELPEHKTFADKSFREESYEASELSDLMDVDPGRFYQSNYSTMLKKGIEEILEQEGPIAEELLITRIKTGHGWKKAGNKIRSRVSKLTAGIKHTKFQGEKFYWQKNVDPANWVIARSPQLEIEETKRTVQEVSPEEINAIREVELINSTQKIYESKMVKQIAYFLGWSHCTEKMRIYIVNALEESDRKNNAKVEVKPDQKTVVEDKQLTEEEPVSKEKSSDTVQRGTFPARNLVTTEQDFLLELAPEDKGSSVRHPKFGKGIVQSIEGSGKKQLVTIKFSEGGIKKVKTVLAKLELVD